MKAAMIPPRSARDRPAFPALNLTRLSVNYSVREQERNRVNGPVLKCPGGENP
jgi:hypothetical protein